MITNGFYFNSTRVILFVFMVNKNKLYLRKKSTPEEITYKYIILLFTSLIFLFKSTCVL